MVRLPTEIDLLGTRIHVAAVELDGEMVGESCESARSISIDSNQSADCQLEVFYHELFHVITDHLGLSSLYDEKTDEALCQGLGIAMAYLISHNELPRLILLPKI